MWIHNPVMLDQVLCYLDIRRNDRIVDCTLGEGGHSFQFLEHLEGGKLLGIEQDDEILSRATKRLQEYTDRFGTPPPEVENLFYAVRIKALAAKAGIESVSTEDDLIIIRRFQGLPFDKEKLSAVLRDGIEVGRTQIRINFKKFFRIWKRVLEELIAKLVT